MADRMNWRCPYCGNFATLGNEDRSVREHKVLVPNSRGPFLIYTQVQVCPNQACKQPAFYASIWPLDKITDRNGNIDHVLSGNEPMFDWNLLPRGKAKPFPDYIPESLRKDYEEACLIADLSPKAAATLCRRCLQGMIRDFWQVDTKSDRLWDEMKAVKEKLDPQTWESIVAVKDIGNVGAHMEKTGVDIIVDVEPSEAQLLIELIESLFDDWYVNRENRRKRHADLKAAAEAKKAPPAK